jgi:ABC-type glycerol-3-phosphate transport system substrate-binding protein
LRLAALSCAALLSACAGSGGAGSAHPDGWAAQGRGASAVWVDPQNPRERFDVQSSTADGSLSDLASAVTTNTVLRHKGARLVRAEPFPACPGEAGWQTFALKTPGGLAVLHVAFTQWNGSQVVASYQRPANLPDDPRAVDALRRDVCSNPV